MGLGIIYMKYIMNKMFLQKLSKEKENNRKAYLTVISPPIEHWMPDNFFTEEKVTWSNRKKNVSAEGW